VSIGDTPQGKLTLLYACALLHELQQQGYIEGGGFSVNADQVYAELKILNAIDGVRLPDQATAIDATIGLMKVRGFDGGGEAERVVRMLLERECDPACRSICQSL
jgi:hypothetical protein